MHPFGGNAMNVCIMRLIALFSGLGFVGVAYASGKLNVKKVTAVSEAQITVLPKATFKKVGHVIEGKVYWPKAKDGSPTGTPAQACARVTVTASSFKPSKGKFD